MIFPSQTKTEPMGMPPADSPFFASSIAAWRKMSMPRFNQTGACRASAGSEFRIYAVGTSGKFRNRLKAELQTKSLQSAFGQFVFVKAEVVAEFVQKCGADFFAEKLFVTFSCVPNIFQKKNDLWWQRRVFLIGKFRSREKAQRVG